MQSQIPPRYKVLEEVGQGGMAVVYRAQDETLKREVAIKLLHAHLSSEPESKARLEREAQAVAKLKHDNILEIYDFSGSDSAASFLVTEFIDGQTLKQFLASRPIAYPEVAALLAVEVAGALAHAHSVGIIHRDVKPENVMIRRDGLVKLMDFGIAQIIDLQRMTVTGQLLGSPAYMAPELIDGKPLDFRTDVFSVGVMLYQLATGKLPFSGNNPAEVLRKITDGRYPDPRAVCPRLSDGLRRIIARAMARQPTDRYPDVAALATDLRAHLAEAGLTDTRRELGAFFADPAKYEELLPTRMLRALIENGRAMREAGRGAKAMDLWNRAFLLDARNPDVLAELGRVQRRRRLRGIAFAGSGVVLLALGAMEVMRFVATPPPAGKRAPEPAMDMAPPATSTASGAAMSEPAPAAAPPSANPPVRDEPARPARPRPGPTAAAASPTALPPARPLGTPRTFTLGPTPQNVNIFLDGEPKGVFGPSNSALDIPDDGRKHVVRYAQECCWPQEFPILPGQPPSHLAATLAWRPAQIRVLINPPDVGPVDIAAIVPGGSPIAVDEKTPVSIPFRAHGGPTMEITITAASRDKRYYGKRTEEITAGTAPPPFVVNVHRTESPR